VRYIAAVLSFMNIAVEINIAVFEAELKIVEMFGALKRAAAILARFK